MDVVSLDGFLDRARDRLAPTPPALDAVGTSGDMAIDPSLAGLVPPGDGKPAAVLIPILARAEPTVLLTRRTDTLSSHKGQIAFPGGRIDAGDASPLATALREAEEEVGLAPEAVEPIGYLDLYRTTTGYRIVPVVALIDPRAALTPNPDEVADVFEVPLAFLMDPRNHRFEEREWQGRMRRYVAMPYGERYIWGVTAGIIVNLHRRVLGE